MSDSTGAATPLENDEQQFSVRYSEGGVFARLQSNPVKPWKLVRGGTIGITKAEILLHGRRYEALGFTAAAEYRLSRSQISNVMSVDREVSFAVADSPEHSIRLMVWAKDAAAAAALAAALPQEQTADFVQTVQEVTTYRASLAALDNRGIATIALVAINVVVFVLTAMGGGGVLESNGEVLVHWGTNYGPLTGSGEWWRLFTSMFLHFGVVHLALNMWALASLGTLTEKLYGTADYLLIYVVAGLGGSLASYYVHPGTNSAGAS